MSSARWQAVAKIFEAALELPVRERCSFVKQMCAGDTELESEVSRLLLADDKVGSFLEKPAVHRAPSSVTQPRLAHSSRRRRNLVAVAIVAFVVSLFAILLRHYWLRAEEAKLAEGSTVLLTNIHNGTGDVRFDTTTELVRYQLLQSPYFRLMDSDSIRNTLAQMLTPTGTELDPRTAREVAMRNGVRRVVFGTLSRVGDSYILDLDIEQPDNSPLRFRQQWENHWSWNMSGSPSARGSDKDMPTGFLEAVRNSSDWIRQEIGESANDVARIDAPPEDVTTSNWEALSEFTQAEKFRAARNNAAALVALRNAVAADPNFALAYARQGDILVSLSRFTEGYAAYDKVLALGPAASHSPRTGSHQRYLCQRYLGLREGRRDFPRLRNLLPE
jgi:hypothetical protein